MSGAISATTLGIIGGIGAAGSVASGVIGANAAGNAASAQAGAANNAAALSAQQAQKALDLQAQQFDTTQANEQPWLTAGKTALDQLSSGTAPGGSLVTPYQSFTAPTDLTEQNDPGYQARLQLGTDAIQKSAAARGSVITGGTAKALDTYGQDYASNEYNNVYNRALNTYGTNATNYYTGQTNTFERLAALSGSGETAATSLGQIGAQTATNEGNILTNTGTQQGQDIQNAGAATASGYVGTANAYGGALSGVGSNLTNLALLGTLSGYGKNPTAGTSGGTNELEALNG